MYIPDLLAAQRRYWPECPLASMLGAQVEHETCPSLSHSKCWNPRAELRTSRENGIGLGQFTTAYRPDGSIRFDKRAELREKYRELSGWDDAFDPAMQLAAIVLMDRDIYDRWQYRTETVDDALRFTLVVYNSGETGLMQDVRLCRLTTGCNPMRWTGNVELRSTKSTVKLSAYGNRSMYEISRAYPRSVLDERRPRYVSAMDAKN